MYSPFRKYAVVKPYYMTPSKHCASQKVIPSHSHLYHPSYEYPAKYPSKYDYPPSKCEYANKYVVDNALAAHELMLYSNSLPRVRHNYVERQVARQPRPKSSFVYQNVHARDEFCVNNECNINRTKSDRVLYSNVPNVKVKNFPMPQFSPSYVQDNHFHH